MGEQMEETHLTIVELCNMYDLQYKGITITIEEDEKNSKLPKDKKKKSVVGLPPDWKNMTFPNEKYGERFNKEPNVAINSNKTFLWIDTDEKEQDAKMTQLLIEKEIYEPYAITPSFKNQWFNLKYKNHYWFRVDYDEFVEKNYKIGDEEIVPISKGKSLRNGWDILYGDKSQIFEWSNSLLGNIPFLSFEDYEYIYIQMEKSFPIKSEIKPVINKPINTVGDDEEQPKDKDIEAEIKNLRILCENLSPTRWEKYDYWLSIAMIFINEKYPIEIFHEYSEKNCPEKFDLHSNNKMIDKLRARPNGLRVATLYSWLKTDNFPVFEKLQQDRTDFWNYLLYHKKLNHLYYANIYYSLEPFKYVRSNDSGWYEYNGYSILKKRGHELPKSMKNDISYKLQKYLTDQRNYVYPNCSNYKEKMELYKVCFQQLGNSSFINGIQDFLVNLYTIENIDDLFDANSNLIAFEDKVYDLEIKSFRDISPKDYITKTTKYLAPSKGKDYEELVKYFKEELLHSIFEDKSMVEYYLIMTSLSLFTTKLETLTIHNGKGGNGKGVLSELIRSVLGDYFYTPENTFLTTTFKAGAPNPSLYACRGIRYLLVSEPDNNTDNKFNVDFVKLMTGGDPITTRTLYDKNNITYKPQFNPHCLCNQKPCLKKFDKGIKRRIKIISYPFNFVDKPREDYPNERPRDYTLKTKLSQEKYKEAWILLLFDYASKWISVNPNEIEIPEQVKQATDDYLEENNPVGNWISERVIITHLDTDKLKYIDAYNDFTMEFRGRLSKADFKSGMEMNDLEVHKTNGDRVFRGIKLRPKTCLIST